MRTLSQSEVLKVSGSGDQCSRLTTNWMIGNLVLSFAFGSMAWYLPTASTTLKIIQGLSFFYGGIILNGFLGSSILKRITPQERTPQEGNTPNVLA